MIGLEDFNPHLIAEYSITAEDLERVIRYVRLLQGEDAPTLADIAIGGYYGTSALLHEVVELDILLDVDPELLQRKRWEVSLFFETHPDVHIQAMVAEHRYLQQKIQSLFGEEITLSALVVANAGRADFDLLVESEIPVPLFEPTALEIERASRLLERLQALGKEMPE